MESHDRSTTTGARRALAQAPRGSRRSRLLFSGGIILLVLTGVAGLAVLVGGVPAVPRAFYGSSSSMAPLLHESDYFFVAVGHYAWREPQRGDVVVYRHPKDPKIDFIKRIVALGGDRIVVAKGRAIVNGVPVNEPYIDAVDPAFSYNNTPETTVPSGSVFVLGDNRANSLDSRSTSQHGPVPIENLIGRATYLVWSPETGRFAEWIGTPKTR